VQLYLTLNKWPPRHETHIVCSHRCRCEAHKPSNGWQLCVAPVRPSVCFTRQQETPAYSKYFLQCAILL